MSYYVNAIFVMICAFRQRFVTSEKSMYRLVEDYLPLQYQQEIIPCASAGNVVSPKTGVYQ